MQRPSLARRVTAEALGTSLLLAAVVGSGIMGERLAGGRGFVFPGFTVALLAMGVVSRAVGRAIDRHGARVVMTLGTGLVSGGLFALSHVHAITVGRVAIGMLPPALTLLLAGTSRLPLVAAFTLLWARRRA